MTCPIELSCTDPNHRRPLVSIETPLYPLSEFTPEEAAKVAEFEAADTPPEVLREQVAAAIAAADRQNHGVDWEQLDDWERKVYRRLADAALAVFRGQHDPAVQRVLALVEQAEDRIRHSTPPPTATRLIAEGSAPTVTTGALRAAIGGDGQ